MQIRMQNGEGLTAGQSKEFLKGSERVNFAGQSKREVYAWIEGVLVAQEFAQQDKKQRGAIRAYVEKVTGLGSAQVTRLVRVFKETGSVEVRAYQRQGFARKYSDRDIALLAEVDRAHERLSGPATRHILEREHARFGKAEYARLAQISSGHHYARRASGGYRKRIGVYEPPRPTAVSMGDRRRPEPQGRPGYLRVDTVHQGRRRLPWFAASK